ACFLIEGQSGKFLLVPQNSQRNSQNDE
ncbi:MAG: hypothetical protein QOI83_4768, partial [Streptomycetaceae bacterium]|nr:hypothetical protein [Streptomycetaceae bacterium]